MAITTTRTGTLTSERSQAARQTSARSFTYIGTISAWQAGEVAVQLQVKWNFKLNERGAFFFKKLI